MGISRRNRLDGNSSCLCTRNKRVPSDVCNTTVDLHVNDLFVVHYAIRQENECVMGLYVVNFLKGGVWD